MVVDVFHGQRPCAAVLHRAVLTAWLRELHTRPCRAAVVAGDLERTCLSGISCGAAVGQATQSLRQLRPALEPVTEVSHSPVVSAIIPCLDEETAIGQVVTVVLAQNVSEVVVVDGGSKDCTVERATEAGARVVVEPQRGYGRAIQAGIAAVRYDAEILVFLDGDGSDPAERILDLVSPIAAGK